MGNNTYELKIIVTLQVLAFKKGVNLLWGNLNHLGKIIPNIVYER